MVSKGTTYFSPSSILYPSISLRGNIRLIQLFDLGTIWGVLNKEYISGVYGLLFSNFFSPLLVPLVTTDVVCANIPYELFFVPFLHSALLLLLSPPLALPKYFVLVLPGTLCAAIV